MKEEYGAMKIIPEFHFGDVYEWKFETTEEFESQLKELMDEYDKDALRFYDVFQNDLICCMNDKCENCHLLEPYGKDGSCQDILEENVKKMIDNQRRMYAEFIRRKDDGK